MPIGSASELTARMKMSFMDARLSWIAAIVTVSLAMDIMSRRDAVSASYREILERPCPSGGDMWNEWAMALNPDVRLSQSPVNVMS